MPKVALEVPIPCLHAGSWGRPSVRSGNCTEPKLFSRCVCVAQPNAGKKTCERLKSEALTLDSDPRKQLCTENKSPLQISRREDTRGRVCCGGVGLLGLEELGVSDLYTSRRGTMAFHDWSVCTRSPAAN